MKTKFYWLALLASAALIAQANAGGHHGGGGGGGSGGNVAATAPGPARSGVVSSGRSMPMRNFGGSRMIYSGQRFSSVGRSPSSMAFRQHYIGANGRASIDPRQFAPGNINRGDRLTRFSNGGNHAITNSRRAGNSAGQVRNGNNLPANWRNHVVAQHSANWHRDWDRRNDHWWHGHRCHFFDGSWVIFDFGFYPGLPYGYPYDYYAYDSYAYPYSYDPGYYDDAYQGEEYYDQNSYDSSDQYTDSIVGAAQKRLAQQGYYRGQIDGILGPETRRAIARYQSNRGLRVTGQPTTDTLQALGLQRFASY